MFSDDPTWGSVQDSRRYIFVSSISSPANYHETGGENMSYNKSNFVNYKFPENQNKRKENNSIEIENSGMRSSTVDPFSNNINSIDSSCIEVNNVNSVNAFKK